MSYRLEKTQVGTDIVIDGWEKGITDNPYEGIFDMRNVDTVTIPGEASVALSTQAMNSQSAITSTTFTVDAGTDVFTYDGIIPLEVNTCITFTNSGGALPTGLSANTPYYILTTPTPTTFTISEISAGGTKKDVTNAGSGTNTFSTINMGIPKYFTNYIYKSLSRIYFMIDSNGRVWVLNAGVIATTNPNKWVYMSNSLNESFLSYGNGFQAYKGYLFVFEPNTIDVIRIIDPVTLVPNLAYLTTHTNWILGWKNLSSTADSQVSHYSLIGQDDVLYICNQSFIASIFETAENDSSVPPILIPISTFTGESFNIAEPTSPTNPVRTVADGVTTSGSANISTVTAFFQSTDVGAIVVGTNIPVGTTIASVTNSTHAVLALNTATGNGTGLTFTITSAYTYNATALSLPSTDKANCLAELGQNLMIGGINNYIYPWDRVSVNFGFPIFLSEYRVSRMVTINTTMYIFCGFKGRIFVTNGANATPFFKVPDYLSKTTNPYIFWTDACFNRNQLYFSFYVTDNSGTTISQTGGLWAVDVDSVFPVSPRLENELSYGTYAGYASAICVNRKNGLTTLPSADGYGLFVGWYDGVSVSNIDVGISTPYTAGQSYIECDPLPLGQFLKPRTLENIQFKLGTPLVSGESVAFYYRKNIAEAYTALPITQGNGVGDISGIAYSNFENAQWLQIKVVLTSTASSPSYVRLRELRLH